MRPAIRSGRPATSRPRRKSARCSASWSARFLPIRGARRRAATPIYAELGPGRERLRATPSAVLCSAGFAGEAHFVETSPILRDAQKKAVERCRTGTKWWSDLPARPLLLVANEFLDALPVRQFVGDIERRVMIAAGGFAFDRDGEVMESSPQPRRSGRASSRICLAREGRRRPVHRLWARAQRFGRHAPGGPRSCLLAVLESPASRTSLRMSTSRRSVGPRTISAPW